MKILNEHKEVLLSRTKYELEIEHIGKPTPKEDSLLNELSSLLKTSPECIVIRHIYTRPGHSISKLICYSYINKESKDKIEEKKKETKENKENAKKESKK